jgi:hypothetical protein
VTSPVLPSEMTVNDTFEDIVTSVMLGAYTDHLLDPVFHRLDKALEILEAYQVCSPERVYLLRPHDFDNLEARGLHPAFLGNLRHWQALMTDHPPPEVEMLQDHGLYFPSILFLYKPGDFERLESNGMPQETLEKLRRWQQHMIDNPAPLPAETWLEIELEDGTIRPVTASVYRIGRDKDSELRYGALSVSGKHCWLGSTLIPDKVAVLTDTSTNGTFVNGHKITKGSDHLLAHGDKVGIGGSATSILHTFVVSNPKA